MKKTIISLDKEFADEKKIAKNILSRLEKIFNLENKYLEIYLIKDELFTKNVLSFPTPPNFPRPDIKGYESLGEIYLNPYSIKKRKEDFVFMLVHGFLHLLGYDHKIKDEAIRMEAREIEILEKLSNR